MRKQYFAQFRATDQEIKLIWKNAYFAFDANTILNLYRYSDQTRSDFLKVLHQLKIRLFLPEQAANEYFNNRLEEIASQSRAYEGALSSIEALQRDLEKSKGHPFVGKQNLEKLDASFKSVKEELNRNRDRLLSRLHKDDILDSLSKAFDGKVGPPIDPASLNEILETGASRMECKVPPGFADYPKKKVPFGEYEKRSNVGDYIVWRQTMDFSIQKKCPIILVSDDAKEDWWERVNGQTIRPRVELTSEFETVTGQKFLLYRPEQFLGYAKDHLDTQIHAETLVEIKAAAEHLAEAPSPEHMIPNSADLPRNMITLSAEDYKRAASSGYVRRRHIRPPLEPIRPERVRFLWRKSRFLRNVLAEKRDSLEKNEDNYDITLAERQKRAYELIAEIRSVEEELHDVHRRIEEAPLDPDPGGGDSVS